MLFPQLLELELEHDARAAQRRGFRPGRKRRPGAGNRLLDFFRGSQRHPDYDGSGSWVVDARIALRMAADQGAIDEVMDLRNLR